MMQIPSNLCLKCMQAVKGQRSAPFFWRPTYEEFTILINFKELTIQQLNRLTFDRKIETGGKMDLGCEGGMGGGVTEGKTGIS